jgi:dTDP-4-dehydrorhamnose 3,5-epimerase
MRRPIEELNGLQVFTVKRFNDNRGFLLESYTRSGLRARGIDAEFKQAIQSRSRRGVVRGLHFQWDPLQGKLVRCVAGAILDVAVDIRPGSPTIGDHAALEMTEENDRALWIPPGFAHGFMALADGTEVFYECTAEWAPSAEGGILWSDPALGVDWPACDAIASQKDNRLPTLAQWLKDPRAAFFPIGSGMTRPVPSA